MAPTFLGGKLNLKGKKKKKTKHDKKSTVDAVAEKPAQTHNDSEDDDDLTKAERKGLQLKKEREIQDIEHLAKQSHRERVEEFNEKLGNLTELNDIPRVSCVWLFVLWRCFLVSLLIWLLCFLLLSNRCPQLVTVRDLWIWSRRDCIRCWHAWKALWSSSLLFGDDHKQWC